ncbi:hypothetical protein DUI87_17292 [Hirundo rustica rustica]|uniref:ADP-ribosylation factor-like protein 6-interacting protein 4 n=1 Tax=Hirundo rustica rustica TaxID=333673 RepID=A0A3M0JXW2_HIRRU|nr:hypothetical protein DUI87_17292 [Hirundo rustica rustica]
MRSRSCHGPQPLSEAIAEQEQKRLSEQAGEEGEEKEEEQQGLAAGQQLSTEEEDLWLSRTQVEFGSGQGSSSSDDSSDSDSKMKKSQDSKKKRVKQKDKKKRKKKKKKKIKKKLKKAAKERAKEEKAKGEEVPGPSLEQWQKESGVDSGPVLTDEQKSRIQAMKPMTKEEWDARQSVIRRVVDPETGRTRLIKGDGEVLEEIVSKERHKEINKVNTLNSIGF